VRFQSQAQGLARSTKLAGWQQGYPEYGYGGVDVMANKERKYVFVYNGESVDVTVNIETQTLLNMFGDVKTRFGIITQTITVFKCTNGKLSEEQQKHKDALAGTNTMDEYLSMTVASSIYREGNEANRYRDKKLKEHFFVLSGSTFIVALAQPGGSKTSVMPTAPLMEMYFSLIDENDDTFDVGMSGDPAPILRLCPRHDCAKLIHRDDTLGNQCRHTQCSCGYKFCFVCLGGCFPCCNSNFEEPPHKCSHSAAQCAPASGTAPKQLPTNQEIFPYLFYVVKKKV